MNYLFYTLIVLCIGSYSAAFTVRWPVRNHYLWRKEAHHLLSLPFHEKESSFSSLRSHCPSCNTTLAWRDMIPLLSYIFLLGKCRHCKKEISCRYSIIEALHVISCLPLIWSTSGFYSLLLHTILFSALITAAALDTEYSLIPDECCLAIFLSALLIRLTDHTLEDGILGLVAGYGVMITLYWFYLKIKKQEGIGLGDIKLVSVLGTWLGLLNLAPLLLYASSIGILYTVFLNRKKEKRIPFGPFLIFSAILVFYC